MTCSPPPRSWADLPWRRCWPGCRRAAYTAGLEPAGRAVEEAAAATGRSAVSRGGGAPAEAALAELSDPGRGRPDPARPSGDRVRFAPRYTTQGRGSAL